MTVTERPGTGTAPRHQRTAAAAPHVRDDSPQFAMTVLGTVELGAGMRRVTFEAPELTSFRRAGADEYFGLVMPRRGRALVMPDPDALDVRGSVAAIPAAERPHLRWYTIRAHDARRGRIDVDVVTHGDSGPGSSWTVRARPGDVAGFRAAGALFRGDEVGGRRVLVADETAVPSVAANLDRLGGARAAAARGVEVHVEVADPDVLAAYDLGEAHVHVRGERAPGSVLVPALTRHLATEGDPVAYAWACGESALAAGARRALLRSGVDRRRVYSCGYWKLGRPRP